MGGAGRRWPALLFFPMEVLRPEEMTVAVFGPGLLGGSLLLEARRLGFGRLRIDTRVRKFHVK